VTQEVGDVLHGIMTAHGNAVLDDPRRLRALLKDLAGDRVGEISLLLGAVDAQVPHRLLDSHGTPVPVLQARLVEDLQRSMFLIEPAARWAVQAWAFALDLASACPPAPGSPPSEARLAGSYVPPVARNPGASAPSPATGPPAIQLRLLSTFGSLEVHSVAFSPDGGRLATAGSSADAGGIVQVWDVSTGDDRGYLQGHSREVHSVAFSADGMLLATGSWDGTARLWNAATGRGKAIFRTFALPHKEVSGVAFSHDGTTLATGSWDGTARLWDVAAEDNAVPFALKGHTDRVYSVAFSPGGKTLATGGADGTRLWDAATGGDAGFLPGSTWSVAFSPDGTLLATSGRAAKIWLWDTAAWRNAGLLEGHVNQGDLGGVNDLAFSPDGTLLASAGRDGTARIWDVTARRQAGIAVVRPEGKLRDVSSVAFSPDGTLLATGGGKWTTGAQVWRLT
jgi:hypothetical protein